MHTQRTYVTFILFRQAIVYYNIYSSGMKKAIYEIYRSIHMNGNIFYNITIPGSLLHGTVANQFSCMCNITFENTQGLFYLCTESGTLIVMSSNAEYSKKLYKAPKYKKNSANYFLVNKNLTSQNFLRVEVNLLSRIFYI